MPVIRSGDSMILSPLGSCSRLSFPILREIMASKGVDDRLYFKAFIISQALLTPSLLHNHITTEHLNMLFHMNIAILQRHQTGFIADKHKDKNKGQQIQYHPSLSVGKKSLSGKEFMNYPKILFNTHA